MIGHDIPPYCIAQGDRCFLRGINIIGLQRARFSEDDIGDVKKVYRLLFAKLGNVKDRVQELPSELAERPHIKFMLEFIEGTSRGICTASRSDSSK